ncbi:hypothetical protein FF1_038849 [Malus domestica]
MKPKTVSPASTQRFETQNHEFLLKQKEPIFNHSLVINTIFPAAFSKEKSEWVISGITQTTLSGNGSWSSNGSLDGPVFPGAFTTGSDDLHMTLEFHKSFNLPKTPSPPLPRSSIPCSWVVTH